MQTQSAAPARAIRRDIPLTNMIRRAFAAGTRDSTGKPGRNYWQLRTEYDINARIEPATHIVTGSETITVHNPSPADIVGIALRLDQNIYAPNVPRAESMPEITYGMRITKLTVNGQPVSMTQPPRPAPGAAAAPPQMFISNATQTNARINNVTIPKAGSATLQIDWDFKVPQADNGRGLRMGAWGDSLFQVAQWYPRIAKYDDLRGWDNDPYLGPSEFYNNFGRYTVHINAPAGWLVASSGVLQNPTDVYTPAIIQKLSNVLESDAQVNIVSASQRGPGVSTAGGDRLTWHFVADSVNDVAWGTSDRYVFDATRANIPGRGYIPVHIYYEPGHASQYARVGQSTRHALEFYSKLWMPYAWSKLDVIDGPDTGMEYPNLIMSAFGAADHETGHQWWPMMVGVNETWYGFMDEGFNQYMNILSAVDGADSANARSMMPMPGLTPAQRAVQPRLNNQGRSYGSVSGNELEAPLVWDANYGGPNYGFQAYQKAPLMLSMLGGIVGDSAVQRAMSDYAKAWRFKHPSPWDYAFFMSNALKADLGWFWNYWLFTTESVEGSIQNVVTTPQRTVVTVRQDGQMPSPIMLKVEFEPLAANAKVPDIGGSCPPAAHCQMMLDANSALVSYPVDVWFGGNRTYDATLVFGGRTIKTITLDPYGRFPDKTPADNVWPRVAVPVPVSR